MQYGEVIVAISAAITLIGVVFNLFKSNSIFKEAVEETKKAETTLSSEHKVLEARQTIFLNQAQNSAAALQEVSSSLQRIDRRLLRSDPEWQKQFSSLDAQQKALVQSADQIGHFAGEYMKLIAENQRLQEQVTELRDQLRLLQEENTKLRTAHPKPQPKPSREEDWEPDLP